MINPEYKMELVLSEIEAIELVIANLSLRVRNLRKLADDMGDCVHNMSIMGHLEEVAKAERGEI